MRFLCLHGYGTSSQVLEIQTATLRYELGDHHTYEFVEGSIPRTIAPEIKPYFPADNDYFAYFDLDDAQSIRKALDDLETYIAMEGPFDGVLAFSTGAALAATLIIRESESGRGPNQHSFPPSFKCAIFLSGGIPFNTAALLRDEVRTLTAADGELIQIPTAHIWGSNDTLCPGTSITLSRVCNARLRESFIHDGGHEVPTSRSKDKLARTVHTIRRTIDKALSAQ